MITRGCYIACMMLLSFCVYAQQAPASASFADSLLNDITSKNHKTYHAWGTIYLLSGENAGTNHQLFDGYVCIDSVEINRNQSSLLTAALKQKGESNLQALCLFSPNIKLNLVNNEGNQEQFLVAFDCGQIASLDGESSNVYLASAEQLAYLQDMLDTLFYRSQKLQQNEWTPLRKE